MKIHIEFERESKLLGTSSKVLGSPDSSSFEISLLPIYSYQVDNLMVDTISFGKLVELEPIEIWNTVVWGSILGWVNLFSYNM